MAEDLTDPRQKGFRSRSSVAIVQRWIDDHIRPLDAEAIQLLEAAGRVLAEDVVAGFDIPGFDRAAMDGYAIRGEDSFGADGYSPLTLRVVGRSRPGSPCRATVGPGEAVEIATGAPIPSGADAVARVEGTRKAGDLVHLQEATAPGRHIGRRGEDVRAGSVALTRGRVLRPQDLGLLSAMGTFEVRVTRRPTVGILVTGDELLPPGVRPEGFKIPDANSPMLAALVTRDGGDPIDFEPHEDDKESIRDTIEDMADSFDLVLVAGGSSTGPEDHAPSVVAEIGRLHFHGIAIRPSSPAGLGVVGSTPVFLLPGNPVSCLCAYDFFASRAVRLLNGRRPGWTYRPVQARLATKLVSAVGRVDYARVRLSGGLVEPIAISGASILSSTTEADGFVVVPEDLEGYAEGEGVTAWLYD